MEFTVHIGAIAAAVIANFFVGYIWYTPLFGKVWGEEMKFDPSMKPDGKFMAKALSLSVLGNFLLAWVLAWTMAGWQFIPGVKDVPPLMNAFTTAFFLWLGFYVPVHISAKTWGNKSWKLIAIDSGYHFVTLLVAALIFAYWR